MDTEVQRQRKDRILDVAIDLATQGGFENVRQRDVAVAAGVALGTLYRAFRSKEDILVAAVEREAQALYRRIARNPISGATRPERVAHFYATLTRGMCRKPHYTRAVIRAMASGEPETKHNLASYREHIDRITIAALRGSGDDAVEYSDAELQYAAYLQDIWFSSLVGWSASFLTQRQVIQKMRDAAQALLPGLGLDR